MKWHNKNKKGYFLFIELACVIVYVYIYIYIILLYIYIYTDTVKHQSKPQVYKSDIPPCSVDIKPAIDTD